MKSSDNFDGLIKGISAPQFLASSAISLLSVLTTTFENKLESLAHSIDHWIRGLPLNIFIFFWYSF